MGGVLIGEGFSGTGHNNDGFFWNIFEDVIHTDGGFLENGMVSDDKLLVVVGKGLADFELVEVLEDGGRVPDDEKFVLEGLVNAGDSGGDGKLMIDKLNIGDRGFEIDGGDFERGIAGGVDERGWLESDKKIDWKHNHKEGGGDDFDETFGPAKRVEVVIARPEK